MGNALSEEEENELLEEAYSMSLESPEADGHLNSGTAAPNCQPKHTKEALNRDNKGIGRDDGRQMNHRGSSVSDGEDDRRGHQSSNQSMNDKENQRKLSYFQMARLGYQELVNAIIRPPRADYKVSRVVGRYKALLKVQYDSDHIKYTRFTARNRWRPWVPQHLHSVEKGSQELILL